MRSVRPMAVLSAVAALLVSALAACTSQPEPAPDSGLIDLTTMRGAMLQATDIGPTWTAPQRSADPGRLVAICGGRSTAPTVPPGAEVLTAALVDEGERGAQTLDQAALVYGDETAAQAGLAALRAVADACPASESVPRQVTDDRSEPAYTETTGIQELQQNGWSGFVVLRHKQYEPTHPSTADTAVAVLMKRNVLLVEGYAVYRLGASSTSPQFTADWQKLIGTVVQRVG